MARKNFLSIAMKLKICELIDKGERKSVVGKRFGIAESTVRTIYSYKEKLKEFGCNYDYNKNFKRMKHPSFKELDVALSKWYKKQRSSNAPVNGNELLAQANKLGKRLGIKDFECGSSWIDRFKKRHNISFGKRSKLATYV